MTPGTTTYGLGMLALAFGIGACTRVSDESRFDIPDETLEILSTTPRPGELSVDPDVRIDLCLSGRVDPRSVAEFDASISSGTQNNDVDIAVQLVPWLEPGVDEPPQDTTGPWCEGSVVSIRPRTSLDAGALYRLRLRPSPVGWSGEALDTEGPLWVTSEGATEPRFFLEFTTDPDPFVQPPVPGRDPPEPAPLTLTDLYSPGGPFDPERALCSCHMDGADLAFARLDLREPTTAFEGLLGSAELRDTGFPMVLPRKPSESFLVQKLARQDGHALDGILGDAMPPEQPLDYLDLLRIVQWIEDGATL